MCGVIEGITAAMTGLQMYGQRQQSKAHEAANHAQAQPADANAKIKEQNQRINDRKAENIADAYAYQQGKLDDKRRLVRGQIAAAQGAAGLTGVGSGLDILGASNDAYYQDSMNLLQNQRNDIYSNRLENWNLENQKIGYLNQASAYRSAAANVAQQGKLGMLSTLAGGALSIYGMKGSSGSKTAPTGGFTVGDTNVNGYTVNPWNSAGRLDEPLSIGSFGKWKNPIYKYQKARVVR